MRVMQEQNSSPVRVVFGVISVLMILYGAYSLGASVMLMVRAAQTPTPPGGNDAAAAIGMSVTAFAIELGVLRGMFSLMLGFGGLVLLGLVDRFDSLYGIVGHIWRELAAKNQTH